MYANLKNMRNLYFISISLLVACTVKHEAEIGNPDQPYIERQPVHYKYAPKIELPVIVNEDESYRVKVPVKEREIVTLHYFNETYPLLVTPDEPLDVYINRARFPEDVIVKGSSSELNEVYQEFLKKNQVLEQELRVEMAKFRDNDPNEVLQIHINQIQLSRAYFDNTPFESFVYKAKGEYLVKALMEIKNHLDVTGYDADLARQAVLDEAVEFDFFTLKSLKSQRAGIRDFTHAFSNTFGIKARLEDQYGRELTDNDVRLLGYKELNAARVSVLDYIEDDDALAHAKMYLVAERIGEAPFQKAEPTYFDYIERFSDYKEYVDFLTWHYEGMKSVQPGQPAISFSIEDYDGNTHTMEDYLGKYVLLDIWASWCIPCLHEFPHMKQLYEKYDRDDFEIVALSIEADREAWENAIHRYNHPWPQLHDGKEFQQETFLRYRGGGIPFYILINRDGKIERHNDIRPSFNLEQVMDSLLYNEPISVMD